MSFKKLTNESKAKKTLTFQNEEKEKRTSELVIANKELLFQNQEKEKRAAELIIANKELLFQNEEKEKRAAELIISGYELQKSENRYRRLFESAKDGILIIDAVKGVIIDVNPFLEEMLGYTKKEFLNKELWEIGLFKDILENKEAFLKLLKDKYIRYDDLPLQTIDGRKVWVEFISNVYEVNGLDVIQCNIRDQTDRKMTKELLVTTNKELRALASHLQSVREEERINIAREIHDELGQQLTGLKMDVYSLNKNLAGKDEKTTVKITEILELTDEIVKSVRRISANLRPTILDDLGLLAALEWQSQEVEKRSEIKVKFDCQLEKVELPADLATSVFRIYQEALNNAVKHSNAHHIFSKFSVKNNRLTLLIRDDGNGMIDHNDQKKTFGLMGIKERVYIFNGRFEITGKPGKGTKIKITIPLQ
jgi:PAS domain S-box-containing protein